MEQLGNWTVEWNNNKKNNVLSRTPLFKPSSCSSQNFSEEFSTSLITKTSYDMVFQVCEGVDYKVILVKNAKEYQPQKFQLDVKEQNKVVMVRFGLYEMVEEEMNFIIQFEKEKQKICQIISPLFSVRAKSFKRIKRDENIQPTTKVQKIITQISSLPQENQTKITRAMFIRCTDEQKTRLRSGSITRSC
eukprot:gene6488-10496_t